MSRTFRLVDPYNIRCPLELLPQISITRADARLSLFAIVQEHVRPLVFEGSVSISDVAFSPQDFETALKQIQEKPALPMGEDLLWETYVMGIHSQDSCILLWRPARSSSMHALNQRFLLKYAFRHLEETLPPGSRVLGVRPPPELSILVSIPGAEHKKPEQLAINTMHKGLTADFRIRGTILVTPVSPPQDTSTPSPYNPVADPLLTRALGWGM